MKQVFWAIDECCRAVVALWKDCLVKKENVVMSNKAEEVAPCFGIRLSDREKHTTGGQKQQGVRLIKTKNSDFFIFSVVCHV